MAEMGCKLSRNMKILPSMCDRREKMRMVDALNLFEDTAALHADHFEIGPAGMDERNNFWVITKIRLHVDRMPDMMDDVEMNTWIQETERAHCERDFSIVKDGEQIVYCRSIWAVINRANMRLVNMKELYPKIDFNIDPPDDRPFVRINRNFDDAETLGEYKVRSVDIDLGGHFNNVNYARAMLGCFSSDELEEMNIRELELNFLSQTYEGETLTFKCRKTDAGLEVGAINEAGKPVFLSLIS